MSVDLFGVEATTVRAMSGHQSTSGGTDEWLTPPEVIEALGPFDLDPCAPINRPWPTARHHYTIADNGLTQPWHGFVWCNPPYANVPAWLAKLTEHGNGIALIFARTETQTWFRHVWPVADGVLFLEGRLNFHYVDGRRVTNPSVVRAGSSGDGTRAVFLDPPYATSGDLYATTNTTNDHHTISAQVREWCATAPDDLRIVLCGYDNEHDALLDQGWTVTEGKAGGGAGYSTNALNGRRERLWASPACIDLHQGVLDLEGVSS